MANIYKIASGVWYAPEWTNSRTGEVVQAHSLGTRDFQVADDTWTLEKARALRPVAASEGHFPRRQLILGPGETFANAVVSYFASKKRWKPATRAAWDEQIDAILDRPFKLPSGRAVTLRGMRIPDFAGDSGTEIVAGWADSEVARLGRTHTVVKRIANLIKPVLEHAFKKGWFGTGRFPEFPELASDYDEKGSRKIFLPRPDFIRLASELAEHDAIVPMSDDGLKRLPEGAYGVYPRLWAMIAVSTGMHASDVDRFSEADWDAHGARWYRVNSKGAAHYRDDWFPAKLFLSEALRRAQARWTPHYCARWDGWDRTASPALCRACGTPARLFVSDGPQPRDQWMQSRLKWGAKRAKLGYVPAPIDFRRTFATWAREEKWDFDEVAKWLANSSGMVREVYAQVANSRFERHVENGATLDREILAMLNFNAMGPRRGPRILRTHLLPRKTAAST